MARGSLKNAAAAAFELRDAGFALKQPVSVADTPLLADMLQDLVDYRLAAYEVRRVAVEPASNVIPFPVKRREKVELPYFPNLKIACGHFKTGRADAEEHRALPLAYGTLDPSRHFIARASGNSMNGGKKPRCWTVTTCCWS